MNKCHSLNVYMQRMQAFSLSENIFGCSLLSTVTFFITAKLLKLIRITVDQDMLCSRHCAKLMLCASLLAYSFAFPISLKKFQNPANEISVIRRIKNKSMTAIWNNPQICFWNILIHLPGVGYRSDRIIVPMND